MHLDPEKDEGLTTVVFMIPPPLNRTRPTFSVRELEALATASETRRPISKAAGGPPNPVATTCNNKPSVHAQNANELRVAVPRV